MANRRVSVIIPTHNRPERTVRAVASALAQTVPVAEIIIVDDASTDDTAARLARWGDPRVRCLRLPAKTNAAHARNVGADQAGGGILAFLDSDDRWRPDHLASQLTALDSQEAIRGVWGGCLLERGGRSVRPIRPAPLPPGQTGVAYLMGGGSARTSTFVFERDAFHAVRFDSRLPKHQDWDLFVRFRARFAMTVAPEPTVRADVGGGDRMSRDHNHAGSMRFYHKHRVAFTPTDRARFFLRAASRALVSEGRGPHFRACYLRVPWRPVPGAGRVTGRILLGKLLLGLPGAGPLLQWRARYGGILRPGLGAVARRGIRRLPAGKPR